MKICDNCGDRDKYFNADGDGVTVIMVLAYSVGVSYSIPSGGGGVGRAIAAGHADSSTSVDLCSPCALLMRQKMLELCAIMGERQDA